jgi:hypothetical protein
MDVQPAPRFVLEVDDHTVELTQTSAESGAVLCLGKCDSSDLINRGSYTSRHHARIELRRHDFFIVDASTNGTFVQTEDEQVRFVHRDALRLWGDGWICLGETLHSGQPIHFRQL